MRAATRAVPAAISAGLLISGLAACGSSGPAMVRVHGTLAEMPLGGNCTVHGGDHVTIFDAEVELVAGGVNTEVTFTDPPNADVVAVELAREAIRRGAGKFLQPRGLGAIIRVGRLVVHPVDFKSRRFEQHTAEELLRLLGGTA